MRVNKTAILLWAVSSFSFSAANADVSVVTSIKPVHSLVSGVMSGVGSPAVIIEGAGSPHTYSLKPSQARQLQGADLVFWMGDELETFLEGPIKNIAKSATSIKLIDSHGLKKIKFREGGMFDAHDDHDDHGGHDDHGHGEHAFEWAGVFELPAGTYNWTFAKVDGDYADPAMKMVILKSGDIEASEEMAETLMSSEKAESKKSGNKLVAGEMAYALNFDASKNTTTFPVEISSGGKFTFFTEHMPFEFEANEHFFKDASGNDVEPIAQEPDADHHGHDDHGHDKHAKDDHDDHGHDKHAKDDHDDHGHDKHAKDDHDDHGHGEFDPHVWLDPINAKAIVQEIEEALVKVDPKNAKKYEANADRIAKEMDKLVEELREQLKPVQEKGFIVFHDAYQYFEQRFGVSAIGSITVSPEVMPGAERVSELRKKIMDLSATCVFSEPQFEPKLVKTLVEGTGARTGVLDPLGASLTKGPDLYSQLVREMARSLKDCLSAKG